ncbi:MAG: EAL domain-containing protein [Syntrophomonadaceae bacterium]|nr:EAL domain-containing protein [Syntrophomonadaceae bacterium]
MPQNTGFKNNFFKLMQECFKPAKKTLVDRTTKLPTLISIFPKLDRLMSNIPVGMLYIDLEGFKEIETIYGRAICSKILYNSALVLHKMRIDFYGQRNILTACSIGGDDFAVFIESPHAMDDFEEEYLALKRQIENGINAANQSLGLNQPLHVHMGYVDLRRIPDYHIESLVYKALKEATYMAKQYDQAREHASWHLLKKVLEQKSIEILYQPIVSLKSGDCLGFEALSRGPAGTALESPAKMFKDAERFNCLMELETLCHDKAVYNATAELGQRYLFLNISPAILSTGNYHKGLRKEMRRLYGMNFNNVVLELTERNGIEDYQHFREVLQYYRRLGFMIAIDDAGAGYSSLQAIAELQPEFVKIDMSLVQGVDKNPTKKALLETFVDFSYKIGARIIGEGIETEEELITLAAMGCDYGQGFLLARPGTLNQEIQPHIREKILLSSRNGHQFQNEPSKIGDIAMYNNCIAPEMPVEEVIEIFNNNKSINGIVICQAEVPEGLIMRDRLFARLGSRYGYDLFIRRSVEDLMDHHPLILPWFTPLEEAARQVAERLDQGITDYIVVTREQRYSGVVSTAKMLDTMAKLQIDQAKDANPLTGLPGNRCITRTISDALRSTSDISVLYFDLDNFKAFNDYYGFAQGDRALAMLGQLLAETVKNWGNSEDLVGHIGGDDFVIITTGDKADLIAANVIARFEEQITELYDQSSLEQGYIIAADRRGKIKHYPIMSLSVAGVSNHANHSYENHLQLGEAAAELKKIAKAQQGSAYIRDPYVNTR